MQCRICALSEAIAYTSLFGGYVTRFIQFLESVDSARTVSRKNREIFQFEMVSKSDGKEARN